MSLLLVLGGVASADTYYVWTNSPQNGPGTNWSTAFHILQDGVNAATAGDTVLVTNGIYNTGGMVTPEGRLTNRVTVTNAITVQSVNGPNATVIEGAGPLGDDAIRCVYLAENAWLKGFMLTNGYTCSTGDTKDVSGGGVYGEYAYISNCLITGNSAGNTGGGSFYGTLTDCRITGNSSVNGGGSAVGALINCVIKRNTASYGGGVYDSTLSNCVINGNSAGVNGGGANGGTLNNCTITDNSSIRNGGGSHNSTLNNCILFHNSSSIPDGGNNWYWGTLTCCCTTPEPEGTGNITNHPQLVDQAHIAAGSPCIGAGSSNYAGGVDIDGNVWSNPPSIGCDEFVAQSATGTLSVCLHPQCPNVIHDYPLTIRAEITGHALSNLWSFGDGTIYTNDISTTYTWTNTGIYDVVITVYNIDQPNGVSATQTITVGTLETFTHYVATNSPDPTPPYTNWATAALTLQDAVDEASLTWGSLVLVTNGVYNNGGAAASGLALTNRVVATNQMTIRSMNGADVTIIEGAGPQGDAAVRCVHLANDVLLEGFTLTNGHVREAGMAFQEQCGGGAYIESGTLSNCVLSGNISAFYGGGTFGGTLNHCTLTANTAYIGGGSANTIMNDCMLANNISSNGGGGCYYGTLNNCTLIGNHADYGGGNMLADLNNCILQNNTALTSGGGSYHGTLNNCVISGNTAYNGGGTALGTINNCIITENQAVTYGGGCGGGVQSNCVITGNSAAYGGGSSYSILNNCTIAGNSVSVYGGGDFRSTINNCIVYYNSTLVGAPNWHESTLSYSCTTPDPGGTGNITDEPRLVDAYHIAPDSPCIGAGSSNYTGGTDIDGDAWTNPPSMGCDEVVASSATGTLTVTISPEDPSVAINQSLTLKAHTVGHAFSNYWDFGDGATWTNSIYGTHSWSTAGVYDVVVTVYNLDNPDGVSDTQSVTVGSATTYTHYVAPNSPSPMAPYTNWSTAAHSLQEAMDIACRTRGALVWVSNGVYDVGGAVTPGYALTNRIVATNSITVRSVNGPDATIIEGAGPMATAAVRCVYLGDSSVLAGFTLTNGCTMASGEPIMEQSGGGILIQESCLVSNCIITGCQAGWGGGSAYGTLEHCILQGNSVAYIGGGSQRGTLKNCLIAENSSGGYGGGSWESTLYNCTITGNSASNSFIAGCDSCTLINSIVYYNTNADGENNYSGGTLYHCCTTPDPGGTGNITNRPKLADNRHIASDSPCIAAGSFTNTTGTDIDREIWLSPPSIGCDEFYAASATGALRVAIDTGKGFVKLGESLSMTALVTGHAFSNQWTFGDGAGWTNCPYASHTWSNTGLYNVEFTAYNLDYPDGIKNTKTITVINDIYYVATNSPQNGPGTNWATAFHVLQDGVDAASSGDLVFVTNGVYRAGGMLTPGYALTNRIVVNDSIAVKSANGPEATIIEGAGPRGPSAVRCAYLANGAQLTGFMLTNGHTKVSGVIGTELAGGGVYGDNNASVWDCMIIGNEARRGGGSYRTTLYNCFIADNYASYNGGGCYSGSVYNCTIIDNICGFHGGGVYGGTQYNCIIYYNTDSTYEDRDNCYEESLHYCCTIPVWGGPGNITNSPHFVDRYHIGSDSPCIGAGSATYALGTDLDGDDWLNPPSIGCDEFAEASATGTITVVMDAGSALTKRGQSFSLAAQMTGHVLSNQWTFGDGTSWTNNIYVSHTWNSAGFFDVVLSAYNMDYPDGVSVTQTIKVVEESQQVHYVATNSPTPGPPYASWTTAAHTVQAAVDWASWTNGLLVLVTNGVYNTGGSVTPGGSLSNRVTATKAMTVQSVNGPTVTIIEGSGPLGTAAVRCVYLDDGVLLTGFTLTNGHTCTEGSEWDVCGAGIYANDSMVSNCVISGNHAGYNGGGSCYGTFKDCYFFDNDAGHDGGGSAKSILINCILTENAAVSSGGGSSFGTLSNCVLHGNSADRWGGGSYQSTMNNCTITDNRSSRYGGGSCLGTLNNCIIYNNSAALQDGGDNWDQGTFNYCCTTPEPVGTGNITNNPILADFCHIAGNSPCIGAGSSAYAGGVDIDGDAWLSPAAIGCDEFVMGSATGALSVSIRLPSTNLVVGSALAITAEINGHALSNLWDVGDNAAWTNNIRVTHSWSSTGIYDIVVTAYNLDYPEGISATQTVAVGSQEAFTYYVSTNSPTPTAPYTNWVTAAHSIQDAVNEASATLGALVLVTDGVYRTGGTVLPGSVLTNRIAVTNAIIVQSVNGAEETIIEGSGPIGESAVRCALLADHAILAGFTLTNGHTQMSGDLHWDQSGAGVNAGNGILSNCVIIGNRSGYIAGGCVGGTLNNCTLLDNSAELYGGGSINALLNNCTLANNYAGYHGGGSCYGTLNYCILTNNSAGQNGGGSYYDMMTYCMLTGNTASNNGGGSYRSVLDYCIISSNSAWRSGGSAAGILDSCTLIGNSAEDIGGGCGNGVLSNCTLACNYASYGAGSYDGVLYNCTLVDNTASIAGGGSYYADLYNCIIYHNTAPAPYHNWYQGQISYSCTTPDPGGTGNITNDPRLVDLAHIAEDSPCMAAGSAAYVGGTDIDGDIWNSPPSMGCDEFFAGSATGTLSVTLVAQDSYVVAGHPLSMTAKTTWHALSNQWNYGDGMAWTDNMCVAHSWSSAGVYDVIVTVYNLDFPQGFSITQSVTVLAVADRTYYVATNSPSPTAPYTSWTTAAHTLQAALNEASSTLGALVLVTNGVYDTGGTVIPGYALTNRMVATNGVTVRSVNGPDVTFIVGTGPAGDAAVRCAYLADNALLAGFTLTNGHTRTNGEINVEQCGGGILAQSASASNCVLTGNRAGWGGGCSFAQMDRCRLIGNSASTAGGGSLHGVLNNCLLTYNHSDWIGGGSSDSTLNNCTLVANSAGATGGGSEDSTLNNCIVYYNNATNADDNCEDGTLNYCCTTPDPGGIGNITNEPGFTGGDDYHLVSDSLCIDSGTNLVDITSDLDNIARPLDGNDDGTNITDIGCYEYVNSSVDSDGEGLSDAEEISIYGTDPTVIDTDSDTFSDYQEMIAATDGTDSNSYFCLFAMQCSNSVAVSFACTNSRIYSLYSTADMMDGPWLPVAGMTNVTGDVGGVMSLFDSNDVPEAEYRVTVEIP